MKTKTETEAEYGESVEGFWGKDFGDRDLVKLDDIIGETVVIEGYDRREGTFGDYFSLYLGENRVVNTGSAALMAKIQAREDLLPAEAVFTKKPLPNGRRMYGIISPGELELEG